MYHTPEISVQNPKDAKNMVRPCGSLTSKNGF
jgi:hypothetical protein